MGLQVGAWAFNRVLFNPATHISRASQSVVFFWRTNENFPHKKGPWYFVASLFLVLFPESVYLVLRIAHQDNAYI